jgi:site-specific recombinase XerD
LRRASDGTSARRGTPNAPASCTTRPPATTASGSPPATATLDELTRTAITTWLADLVEAGRAPGTIRTRWKGLNRFCGWLVAEGVLDEHPMAGLAVPKVPERPVPLLSDDELAALIRACAGRRWYDRRDEAVIRFLLDATGRRRTTVPTR